MPKKKLQFITVLKTFFRRNMHDYFSGLIFQRDVVSNRGRMEGKWISQMFK
jgi:hypothetical protein